MWKEKKHLSFLQVVMQRAERIDNLPQVGMMAGSVKKPLLLSTENRFILRVRKKKMDAWGPCLQPV